jgi:hypothetical protein
VDTFKEANNRYRIFPLKQYNIKIDVLMVISLLSIDGLDFLYPLQVLDDWSS